MRPGHVWLSEVMQMGPGAPNLSHLSDLPRLTPEQPPQDSWAQEGDFGSSALKVFQALVAGIQRSHFPTPYTGESYPKPFIPREFFGRDRLKRPREEREGGTTGKHLWKPLTLSLPAPSSSGPHQVPNWSLHCGL